MPEIRVKFDCHGMGDRVHFAHLLQLYRARGYSVAVHDSPGKEIIWKAAGCEIINEPDSPHHHWSYHPRFTDLDADDYIANKIAHNIGQSPLPAIDGDRQSLFHEVCQVKISAAPHIGDQSRQVARQFIDGLPKPIICLHVSGNSWRDRKSVAVETAFHLVRSLLDATGGSVVSLDWDSRDPIVAHERCRPIIGNWGRINPEELCALYEVSDLLIGIDSGPFHLASLAEIKCLGVFYPTLHPVQCCLPNQNATYLVTSRFHDHWTLRCSQWKLAEYEGDHPSVNDIAGTAVSILKGHPIHIQPLQESEPSPADDVPGMYHYDRVGYDLREMELLPGGAIGIGAGVCEKTWQIEGKTLILSGDLGPICCLRKTSDGRMWVGEWVHHERMVIRLEKLNSENGCSTNPIVFTYHGINVFGGLGDAVVAAWFSEGSKRLSRKMVHHAHGNRRRLLELLGQTVVDTVDGHPINGRVVYGSEKHLAHQGMSRLEIFKSRFGFEMRAEPPIVSLPPEAAAWAYDLKAKTVNTHETPLVLLCPKTPDRSRQWREHRWVELYGRLASCNCNVVALTEHYEDSFAEINPLWGLSVDHWVALISVSDFVITHDSASAHLAGLLGVPSLVILGPTTADCVFREYPSITGISLSKDAYPCIGCHYSWEHGYRNACGAGCAVLEDLTVDAVYNKAVEILGAGEIGMWK